MTPGPFEGSALVSGSTLEIAGTTWTVAPSTSIGASAITCTSVTASGSVLTVVCTTSAAAIVEIRTCTSPGPHSNADSSLSFPGASTDVSNSQKAADMP